MYFDQHCCSLFWSIFFFCSFYEHSDISHHIKNPLQRCINPRLINGRFSLCTLSRASDISRKKKQNFAGFSGANSRKNRPISREKSHNSRDFRGRKVKIRRKIVRFRGILAEKSQISKDFQGQILRKIGRFPGLFHSKFQGETSPRNNR